MGYMFNGCAVQWGHRDLVFSSNKGKTVVGRILSFGVITLLLATIGMADASEKEILLGTVENVIIHPWDLKLPARIDTGAAKSSLDVRELKVQDNTVEFKLPEKVGGLRVRLPIIEWRHVRTKEGLRKRPVIELELCIGTKRLRTLVNLEDRTGLKYPLLVGRNTLKGNFVVDAKRRHLAPPNCQVSPP